MALIKTTDVLHFFKKKLQYKVSIYGYKCLKRCSTRSSFSAHIAQWSDGDGYFCRWIPPAVALLYCLHNKPLVECSNLIVHLKITVTNTSVTVDSETERKLFHMKCLFVNAIIFYRPQTKFAKVIFSHLSVILSTGGVPRIPPCHTCPPPSNARKCCVHNIAQKRSNAGGMHPTGMLFLLPIRINFSQTLSE